MFKSNKLKATEQKLQTEKLKVHNRDMIIKDLTDKIEQLKQENTDLRYEKEDVVDVLREIYKLNTSNHYDNDKIFKRKINELAQTAIIN